MYWFIVASLMIIASCSSSENNIPQTQSNDAPTVFADQPGPVDDDSANTNKAPPVGPVINRDNHVAILTEVLKVYTGQEIGRWFRNIPTQADKFGPATVDTIGDSGLTTIHSCDNGGTVSLEDFQEFGFSSTEFDYNDCQLGQITLDGDYRLIESDEETLRSSKGGLTVAFDEATSITFNGLAAFSCCLSPIWYLRTSDLQFSFTSVVDQFKIIDATTRFTDGENFASETRSASMTGSYQIESHTVGNQRLTVSIGNDFAYESEPDLSIDLSEELTNNWTFAAGQLQVTAEDGSELSLNADSGDASTASITLVNSDGTETFDQPWSLWTEVLYRP